MVYVPMIFLHLFKKVQKKITFYKVYIESGFLKVIMTGLDDYISMDIIGEGSFGRVYKARKKNTGFTVAIKFITKHGKSEKDLRNLRQEIRILRKLKHDNIILMFDAF